MPAGPFVHTLLALLVGALCSAPARAQASPGESRPAESGTPAHAWLLVPGPEAGDSLLIHVPPRRAPEGATYRASETGTLRVARRLARPPRSLGSWGANAYLLMPSAGAKPSRVLALRALPTGLADFWSYQPSDRLESLDPLPDGFRAESIAGTADGPAVIGELGDRRVVLAHRGAAWTPLEFAPLGSGDALVAGRTASVIRTGDGVVSTLDPGETPTESSRRVVVPALKGLLDARATGSRLLVALDTGSSIEVLSLSQGEPERIASVEHGPGVRSAAFVGEHAGSLVIVRAVDESSGRLGVVEISTVTGRTLYEGAARNTVPISADRFRLLALILVGLTVLLLLLTIRGGGDRPVVLPNGFALAEPSRRLVATLIDSLVAALIVSVSFGVPLLDLLSLRVLFGSGDAWLLVPTVLGVGFVLGVSGESLTGRTLGKALTGCRVARIPSDAGSGPPRSPSLARSALRNLIKWGLPPVSVLALVDPSGRSRADVVSGLLVVTPLQEEPDA